MLHYYVGYSLKCQGGSTGGVPTSTASKGAKIAKAIKKASGGGAAQTGEKVAQVIKDSAGEEAVVVTDTETGETDVVAAGL